MNNDAINDMNSMYLSSLPPLDPPPALWASIRSELDQRQTARRHRRGTFSASAVAAVAVAVLAVVINLVHQPNLSPGPDSTSILAMSADESALIQARQVSALLEASLRRQNLGAVNTVSVESLVWLENELGWLDTRLASNPNDLDLWQQRNQLLNEMNRLYGQSSWQAQMQHASLQQL